MANQISMTKTASNLGIAIGDNASATAGLIELALPTKLNQEVQGNKQAIGTSAAPFNGLYLKDQSGTTTSILLQVEKVSTW